MTHNFTTRKGKIIKLEYIGKYTIFTNEDGSLDIRKKYKNFYYNKNKKKYYYLPVSTKEEEFVLKQRQ
jgi:hypothetical protein